MRTRWLFLAAATAVLAVAGSVTVAVATATVASPAVKACVTSTGFLKLATSSGGCPTGSTAVSINQQGPIGPRGLTGPTGPRGLTGPTGPRGPAGPGALTKTVDATGIQEADLVMPKGDKVRLLCGQSNSLLAAQLSITSSSASARYYIHGDLFAKTSSDTRYFDGNTLAETFVAGFNQVGLQSSGNNFVLAVIANTPTGSAFTTGHLLINAGSDIFTLDLSLYSAAGRCQMTVQLTPSA